MEKFEPNATENKPMILIVDDEEEIRKTLATILNENNYIADTAATGEEAIRKTNEKWYDVALVDVVLPDINGIELLKKLKERKPKTRKIIMTGFPSLQNAVDAINIGADAYIMKPFEVEKMLATLNEQLEKQKEEMKAAREHFERGRLRGRIELLARNPP